ncbi:MAG: beta-lactamase family protein [Actinobacteria bacterium]|nr:beta-lactamase family protein [Actinomycetota bacterium]MCA1722260.1 beta-lactamase family protein [Actinomycetota bacterium]
MTTADAGPEGNLIEDAELSAVVAAECERLDVPGCAVGVRVGARSFTAFHGVTDVHHPRPIDGDTLFMIGSTTKTLTATTVMTLVQEGRLSLDDRVVDHLPELALQDEQARQKVTVGQLLDHTAGWRGDVDVETGWGDDALARAVSEVAPTVPQLFAPGEMASYNNLSLVLAGRLIEQVTGEGYEAAVRSRVLEPLGMSNTFFFPWEVATRPMATGHAVTDGRTGPAYIWPMSRGMNPAGGAVSSLRDQLRYAQFHLDGTASGPAALADDLRRQMQKPRVTLPSGVSGVGVSWLLKDRDGVRMVTHGGNCSNLYVSSFALVPDEGLAVTVLGSSRGGGAVGAAVTEWAVQRHLGRPAVPAPDLLPLTPELAGQYVGRYDAGQWDLDVTASDGRLFVQLQLTDVPSDTPEEVLAAFRTPPSEVVLVAPDVVAPAAAPADSAGDFVRDDAGAVAWLRYGLRLARRRM